MLKTSPTTKKKNLKHSPRFSPDADVAEALKSGAEIWNKNTFYLRKNIDNSSYLAPTSQAQSILLKFGNILGLHFWFGIHFLRRGIPRNILARKRTRLTKTTWRKSEFSNEIRTETHFYATTRSPNLEKILKPEIIMIRYAIWWKM